MRNNKYFYRGIVHIVIGSIETAIGLVILNHVYAADTGSLLVFASFVIAALGISGMAEGIYYLIPFRYGSAWNGELRLSTTAFEGAMFGLILLPLSYIGFPNPFPLDSKSLLYVLIVYISIMWLIGRTTSKRAHGPVRESKLDKILARKGIY